jgi:hypothetical protein
MAHTPGSDNATYGGANWSLNTGRKPLPAAPETAVRFTGNGSNIIYIDWETISWPSSADCRRRHEQLGEKIIALLKAPAKTTTSSARGQ